VQENQRPLHGIKSWLRYLKDKIMKKAFLIASTAFLTASFSYAGGEGWMHDFEAAKKKAAEEKKDLLIDFTGSDWCPPCKDLSARILSQDSFKTAAEKNYILVELDFPNDKSKMSEETIEQNQMLAEKYGIQGFPTILLTDAQGRPFGQTGHRPGSPEDYLKHLTDLQKSKTARDAGFTKAEKAEGIAKAKALYEGLQEVPVDHQKHYTDVVEAIKANDPKDETGLAAAEAKRKAAAKAEAEMQAKMEGLQEGLSAAMQAGDTAKALTLVDEYVAKEKLEGVEKQQVLGIKINLLMEGNDLEAVEKVADEIIAVDPNGEFSKQVANFKNTQLKKLKEAREEQEKTEEAPAEKE